MCGIVGVIAKYKAGLFKGAADLFQQIFLVDQIRGTDGAGIIWNDADGINYLKAPFGAGAFMSQPAFKEAMEFAVKEGHFIIGHNRAATRGSHVWANTHPFKEGPLLLVHNGTLFDHKNLDKEVEVDSHAIAKHMAANGVEATLKEIDGAFALVWTNEEDQTINMARNKERPLHLVETPSCWIVSSELGLGLWMAERHKLKVEDSFQLETETLYTFKIGESATFTTKKVEYFQWLNKGTPAKSLGSWYGRPEGADNEEVTTPFQSRRQRHQQKKKAKGKDTSTGGATVIAFPSSPQKSEVPATRGYGTKVKFQPAYARPSTCIFYDQTRKQSFMLGRVEREPMTEIRVYGKEEHLQEYQDAEILEGRISYTKIHGKMTSYQVEDVRIVDSAPTVMEAVNELALQKYCDKNGLSNSPLTTIKCDCCSTPIFRKDTYMRSGKPLCDTCNTAFSSNKQLAVEFGFAEND